MKETEKIEIMRFDQEGYLEDGKALYETGKKMTALADKVADEGYDAHQEHGVVALVGDLVGELNHLLAGLVDVLAVLDVALLAKVHDLDLLGFLHGFSFLSCTQLYTSRFFSIPIIDIHLICF